MNLLVFDPETGVILSEGWVNPEVAFPADQLPPGSVYVDAFPPGPKEDLLYIDGEFVPAERSESE